MGLDGAFRLQSLHAALVWRISSLILGQYRDETALEYMGVTLGCPTISQVWDNPNYFYSWRFGGMSEEIFIKTKEKY